MTNPDTTINDDILYSCEAGIARITLNRPDAANALTPDQRNRLIELLAEASVVLTGTLMSGLRRSTWGGSDTRYDSRSDFLAELHPSP